MTCYVQLKSNDSEHAKLFRFHLNSSFEKTKENAFNTMGFAGTFHSADEKEITDNETLKAVFDSEHVIQYRVSREPVAESSFPVQATFGNLDETEQKYRYEMNREQRGYCIIINNENFVSMPNREGSDVDVEALKSTFEDIGFKVHTFEDLNANVIHTKMIGAAEMDHSNCDCFVAVFLSHGGRKDNVDLLLGMNDNDTKEGWVPVERLIEPFKRCESLAGKPKIFIFQACRGDEGDGGICCDADVDTITPRRIPECADFLFIYSCPSGTYSIRNSENGSWFIQTLCQQLKIHHKELDLVTLLTRVNKEMAVTKETTISGTLVRQVSSFVSTLTKDLYFP